MAWILAQGLDAREIFPLSTEFRLARLFEANTRYQLVQQDLHENKLQALYTLRCPPCYSNTFYQKISRP